MKSTSQRGLAVITGAAGGLGSAFANKLAELGYHLLLVDRRQAQLEQLCESLAARHGDCAEPYAIDLCKRDEVEQLANRLGQTSDVELLVNNVGFGTVGYFIDTDASFLVGMVDLHVVTPTILTRAVLPGMVERNRGGIINVSSLAAWFQCAGNVQYGSTKNYLAAFSKALQQELRGTNVCVQALCPGFTKTEFHDAESMKGFSQQRAPAASLWMSADKVVDCSLRNLSTRRVLVTPGLGYRILGRFAQMPIFQPIFNHFANVPRLAPTSVQSAQPAEPRPVPGLRVAKSA